MTGIARTQRSIPHFDKVYTLSTLPALLPHADVVILAIPSTAATKQLFNEERFSQMKPSAILVNIARGDVVDEAALTDALKHGKLSGAVLDVFTTEPLSPDSPLWEMPTVIITPHNSFIAEENHRRLQYIIFFNLNKL